MLRAAGSRVGRRRRPKWPPCGRAGRKWQDSRGAAGRPVTVDNRLAELALRGFLLREHADQIARLRIAERVLLPERPLGVQRTDLAVLAAVAGDSVYLLTHAQEPVPQIAVWRIDAG